ncbi:MAG: glycerol-3-phosphate dehydrogenase/oxidase [Anaerolineae bacterium]|nr:glycerol-3-phosphate dehydrogenase/oxidase [Anaerolineae bacterium]MBT7189954.1 glycerol-3-phosphate dehydrogenase/oxidase [Anaerolineae bacterium]MBT7602007.1 glycerol-3-phosphate dehydrogenase/oxidase [Anaerolineae bacterium]MBT7988404.1 glycerol-3-phosphate dehydrogenase/oxidase [Anaerolineae bacterium]
MNRQEILTSLKSHSPTVLIIGGGINGVGTFRDLALNGVDVLLIDRSDFCSGASAASSHMAHGGIRYLENGEFRLVREAVQERNRMIENAPHIVRSLPTTIPIFKFWSGLVNAPLKFLGWLDKPSERGAFIIKVGLMLYDAFTRAQGTVPPHCFEGRVASLKKFPQLNPDTRYTATYYDGSIFSPERFTVELILDAEAEGPHARALNYILLNEVNEDKVFLQDELTGQTFELSPHLIINAAGPWIDQVNTDLGLARRYIGGTKGSHLVLDHPDLRAAVGENEFFFENKDGRIVLIFPLLDKVIVGTSDIPIKYADEARCTEEEVDYFFEMIGRVFPDIKIERKQIIFRFSGVRPLEYSHAKTAGQITRDHSIKEDQFGNMPIYSLVGGKWTSYRAFSEQVADKVLSFLQRTRKADTKQLPIGGGRDYALMKDTPEGKTPLFIRYGSRCREITAYQAGDNTPLMYYPDMTRREIIFLAEKEKIVHLDDLILRRSLMAYLGNLTRPLIDELADILAEVLGWSDTQKQAEVERVIKILQDRHEVYL